MILNLEFDSNRSLKLFYNAEEQQNKQINN